MFSKSSSGRLKVLAIALVLLSASASGQAQELTKKNKEAIQAVLDAQIAAWNRGDLEGFMAGYWHSPDLVYLSNDSVVHGWQALLDRYRERLQTPRGLEMGSLALTQTEFTALTKDAVVVWGTYKVTASDGSERGGLYTLALRHFREGWRTVYDRTSVQAASNSGK